jgi:hypothetical protein
LGFKKSEADAAVFYIHTGKDILILAIHVDDCTMTGSSDDLIQSYKLKIKSKYDFTDLRPIYWLLNIKITQDCENCTISLPNHVISTHSLGDLILQTSDLPQHLWTQYLVFEEPVSTDTRTSCRNVPHPLLRSCWLAPIPCHCHMPSYPVPNQNILAISASSGTGSLGRSEACISVLGRYEGLGFNL